MSQKPSYISQQELVKGLREVGFPEDVIPTMTAIAGAESSYNLNAYNPRGADDSYGLFQINFEGPLREARLQRYGLNSPEEALDFKTNLRAAKDIYDNQGLSAWGAYTNRSYEKFLPDAQQAVLAQPTVKIDKPTNTLITQEENVEPYEQEKDLQKPKQTTNFLRDRFKEDFFNRTIQAVVDDVMQSTSQQPKQTNADVYMEAAYKLMESDDPRDQELAIKYETMALQEPSVNYTPRANPVDRFAGLFGQ